MEPAEQVEQTALPLGHEVVKWDNAMNEINLASLSVVEMNLFTAICAQVVERNADEVHLTYSALRELMHYKSKSRVRFAKMVVKATDRLRAFSVTYERGDKVGAGQLFYNVEANKVTGDMTVAVNPKVLGILNDLTNHFTLFLQPDWVMLDSKYAKLIYLMVMQWRTTGKDLVIPVPEFRQRLGIPDSMSTSQVTKRIILPVEQQLNQKNLVPGFKITPISRGRKYIKYRLSFDALPKLRHTTPAQDDRIRRLTEVAEAKDPQTAAMYGAADRRVLSDATLTHSEARQQVRAHQRAQGLPDVPIFKLTD